MKYLFLIALLNITLLASSGLKKEAVSWREIRAQQQADSTAYEAVNIIDSIYKTKAHK